MFVFKIVGSRTLQMGELVASGVSPDLIQIKLLAIVPLNNKKTKYLHAKCCWREDVIITLFLLVTNSALQQENVN